MVNRSDVLNVTPFPVHLGGGGLIEKSEKTFDITVGLECERRQIWEQTRRWKFSICETLGDFVFDMCSGGCLWKCMLRIALCFTDKHVVYCHVLQYTSNLIWNSVIINCISIVDVFPNMQFHVNLYRDINFAKNLYFRYG